MSILTKLGVLSALVIGTLLLFPAGTVHGHGLEAETISAIDIQGKDISISVEMPLYFEDNHGYITVTAVEDETQKNVKNITFLIGLFHNGEMVFRNHFFADDGVSSIQILPFQKSNDFMIKGVQDSRFGAWYGTESNPLEIASQNLTTGGLYTFEIEVITIDKPTNIVENSGTHNVNLSVIETSLHIQKDAENNDVKFITKSYFDKISGFVYNSGTRQIILEMPFDWSEEHLSHIPTVRVEVYLTEDFVGSSSPRYIGHANGIELSGSSIIVDDHTEEDKRIIHLILSQDHLRHLKNEITGSGDPIPDNIVFTLSASGKTGLPLTAYTKGGDYQVVLSWNPIEIEPGIVTDFIFSIRNGVTGEPLKNSNYAFVIIQNGEESHRVSGTTQVGGGFENFTFTEEQTGPTLIRFENIRNGGQDAEFGIAVVGEPDVVIETRAVAEVEVETETVVETEVDTTQKPDVDFPEPEPGASQLLQDRTIYEKTGVELKMEKLRDENRELRNIIIDLKSQLQKILGLLSSISR